jgi:NADH:ubiquinone oxidoreductase subunit 3 (subunit A)
MERFLTSPPAAFCVLLALVYGLYRLGGAIAARGEDHPGKHQPYACGEDLPPPEARLTYRAFFRLALMFGILHLATLVVSTVPQAGTSHWVATGYLIGIGVAMLVLTEGAW